MNKRTDVHRPSAIKPDEYEFVCFIDHRPDAWEFNATERKYFMQHMERTGAKFSTHEHGGVCHVCGNANAMSVARFYHPKSNTYIEVGSTCMDKMDGDPVAFRAFKERIAAGLGTKAGKARAQAFLDANGLSDAWLIFVADAESLPHRKYGADENGDGYTVELKFEERTIRDIVRKLVQYGSISAKQTEFVRKLLSQIPERAEREAKRAAEAEDAKPIPPEHDGTRVEIVGTILGFKSPEFGPTRMLVASDDGWKVFGTAPAAITVPDDRGARIRFAAKIKISDNDPKFGFFSRPTKAEIEQQKETDR